MVFNTDYFDLTVEQKIHEMICEIFRPDDTTLSTPFYTFRNEGTAANANFSSTPSAKGMDTTTTDLKLILNSSIPNRLVLSRQFIGWRARVSTESDDGSTKIKLPLYTGVVTSASIAGITTTIEITSQAILLRGKPPIILSNNCPLIFGSVNCGVSKQTIWTNVSSVVGGTLVFTNPVPLVIDSNALYAIEIGDQSFRVVNFTNQSPTAVESATLEISPIATPDTVAIVRTCDQTIQQCRRYQNSARYRGSVLPRNPLSTR